MVQWKSLEDALADPIFNQCRSIVGAKTESQSEALMRALLHFGSFAINERSAGGVRWEAPTPMAAVVSLGDVTVEMRRKETVILKLAIPQMLVHRIDVEGAPLT
jgi:hypothetical protein